MAIENTNYDSTVDTKNHIDNVCQAAKYLADAILHAASVHDKSKLEEPEKSVFDRVTPRLKELEYGTEEYKASLADMGEALTHHYANNRHHPEHFEYGVTDMTLVDVVEMFCDWYAAVKRTKNGNLLESIKIKRDAGVISEQLADIFVNTFELVEGIIVNKPQTTNKEDEMSTENFNEVKNNLLDKLCWLRNKLVTEHVGFSEIAAVINEVKKESNASGIQYEYLAYLQEINILLLLRDMSLSIFLLNNWDR